jgi:hypothetical protein
MDCIDEAGMEAYLCIKGMAFSLSTESASGDAVSVETG